MRRPPLDAIAGGDDTAAAEALVSLARMGRHHASLSAALGDEKMRTRLGNHLAPRATEGRIEIWHDCEIEAGADWAGEIDRELDGADLILLLVSASFLASPYCRKELLRALERRQARQAVTIPVILRDCDWKSVFNSRDYKAQALPRDDRPVAGGKWPNQDAAFAAIASELRTVIERMGRPAAGFAAGRREA